jgi:hypothetical protein
MNNQSNHEHEDETDTEESAFLLRRPRSRPLLIGAVVLLVVVIVAAGIVIASAVTGRIAGTPPPGTLQPGENLFYLATDVPWSHISIDGQVLTHLPPIGGVPLELSEGKHELVWQAKPFASQSCLIEVLPQLSIENTCATNTTITVTKGHFAGLQANMLVFMASPTLLTAQQHDRLLQATQAYLDTFDTTETVQPGDPFVNLQAPNDMDTAKQPLQAAFTVQLDTQTRSDAPCIGSSSYIEPPIQTCLIGGQDCHLLCSLPFAAGYGIPFRSWETYAVIRTTWTYSMSSGTIVAKNQPDRADSTGTEYLFPLSMTWHGSQWTITNDFRGQYAGATLPTPGCIPAQIWATQQDNEVQSGGQQTPFNWEGFDGISSADCALTGVAQSSDGSNTPPTGSFLYRFGVLSATNGAAHSYFSQLPITKGA